MNSEDEGSAELERLEDIIATKIHYVKAVINEEDRWVA